MESTTELPQDARIDDEAPKAVIVGVEGPESLPLLRWAASHAKPGQQVLAMSVWHFPGLFGVAPQPSTSPMGQHQTARDELRASLDEVVGSVDDGHGRIRIEMQEGGHPGHALVEASKTAEMLVVGAGRQIPGVHNLGATASFCLHHAHCPVVVVRGDSR